MGLKSIRPRLSTIAPLVARPARDSAEASRARDEARDYRAWYKTARWRLQRLEIIWRDQCVCAKCGRQAQEAAQLVASATLIGATLADQRLRAEFGKALTRDPVTWVADHIVPHRGDEAMFWDIGNGQCLCKPCHDRDKQREERRGIA